MEALIAAQQHIPLVFPVHPRTLRKLTSTALLQRLVRSGVRLTEPSPYVAFLSVVSGAAAVITDSGGIQEETTYLGIPCITLRDNTERPIITEGTNRLAKPDTLVSTLLEVLSTPPSRLRRPELWDGNTAARCVADLRARSADAHVDCSPAVAVAARGP